MPSKTPEPKNFREAMEAEPPAPPGPMRLHTGTPGTHTVTTEIDVICHTQDGDEHLIFQKTIQPDAPITTVLAHEAAEIQKLCLLLAVGAEAADLSLEDGPVRDWVNRLAVRAREVNLLPTIVGR